MLQRRSTIVERGRCNVMSKLSKRSMVYFEADVHQALRIKAATTHQSVVAEMMVSVII